MFFWHRRPKYKNEVSELLAGDFYMMVLPDEDPFPTEEVTVRSYDGDGYRCGRIPYPAEGFHTKACLAALRRRQCDCAAAGGCRTRCVDQLPGFPAVSHAPAGAPPRGKLRILRGRRGRLFQDPRGRPDPAQDRELYPGRQSWQLRRDARTALRLRDGDGHIYRVDPNAKTVWEMVPDFGHSEIVDLLDYYVGLQHFRNENLTNIALYTLEEC